MARNQRDIHTNSTLGSVKYSLLYGQNIKV